MEINKITKESFSVIGKEGSTTEGNEFIGKLWNETTTKKNEIISFAKKDENGNLIGFWGAMSDFSHSFKPWEENFSKGLYLAGIEVIDEAQPPEGWVKWTIPSYEYIYVKSEGGNTFSEVIKYLNENNIQLVGAVHEFNNPKEEQMYLYFPIRKF
ncbi:MAG: GyrI-like domain-containing protein [Spirochaetales bacterium]|nr:GyrI-like domain-containing protein [Spirochaetales bacterium]